MQRSSPEASTGFRMFDASSEPGVAADQRIDLTGGGARDQIDGEAAERILAWTRLVLVLVGISFLDLRDTRRIVGDLRDAVRDVTHDVEAGDAQLLEEVRRM